MREAERGNEAEDAFALTASGCASSGPLFITIGCGAWPRSLITRSTTRVTPTPESDRVYLKSAAARFR